MTDELGFQPAQVTFRAGETVRFEITNAGAIVHEFMIGDEAAQEEFEKEMSEGDGMAHDGDAGVSVEPGESEPRGVHDHDSRRTPSVAALISRWTHLREVAAPG